MMPKVLNRLQLKTIDSFPQMILKRLGILNGLT